MSYVAKILKSSADPIYLLNGKDHTNRKAWYCVMVKSSRVKSFEQAFLQTAAFTITDYGRVLASGYGEAPSEEILARLKEEYNF